MTERQQDNLSIHEALAIIAAHEYVGRPWVVGPESAVISEARRIVGRFADNAMKRVVAAVGETFDGGKDGRT